MSDAKSTMGQDAWKKMMDDSVSRFEKAQEEMARFEQIGMEQAKTAIDEMAKLQKESLAYMSQLGAEWRKATLEAMKTAGAMFTRSAE